MADTDWEQVNIRLEPERKENWSSAVEGEATYESLTHLIRLAVEKELNDAHDQSTESIDEIGKTSQETGEVLTRLNSIEGSVEDIDARLNAIERESETEDSKLLKNAIFEVLPRRSELSEEELGITAGDIADRLGVTVAEVKGSIDEIGTSQIESEEPLEPHAPEDYQPPTFFRRK